MTNKDKHRLMHVNISNLAQIIVTNTSVKVNLKHIYANTPPKMHQNMTQEVFKSASGVRGYHDNINSGIT